MMHTDSAPPPLSRRGFTRLSLLAALSLLLEACAEPAPTTPTTQPTPLSGATQPVVSTRVPPTSTLPQQDPTSGARTDRAALLDLRNRSQAHVETLIGEDNPRYGRLLVRPLTDPTLTVNAGGDELQRAASTVKPMILLYALFRDPNLPIKPWGEDEKDVASDAYRMIVSSHNSATARILAAAAGGAGVENALNLFNDFLHEILLLPNTVGLTRWNYFPTSGVETDRLSEPTSTRFPNGIPNPISLQVLADFYEMLESPDALEAAAWRAAERPEYLVSAGITDREAYVEAAQESAVRARTLLSIPDPDYVTQMDIALVDAEERHPGVNLSMYGKNGTISPNDWSLNIWLISEAVVLTVASGTQRRRFVVAFSSGTFRTADLLAAAIDYCVELTRLGIQPPGG